MFADRVGVADVGRCDGVVVGEAEVGRSDGVAVSVGSAVAREGADVLGDVDAVGLRVGEAEGGAEVRDSDAEGVGEERSPLRLADGVPRSEAVGLGEK